jgi:K(+)-stimulated pyrophosphate-energized sodium pump
VLLIALGIFVVLLLRRPVRHRHRRGRHARDGRRHDVGRRVRPDRGQRGRHRGDEPPRPETRAITDELDSLGNTTAAIGKGFAIGSAALTALALFSAYASAVGLRETGINLIDPEVTIGLLLGGVIPFFVAALTMTAVGRAAGGMVDEVRRQFREIPGLMEGTAKPDSARCVDISTKAALREMIAPGLVAVLAPVVVGYVSVQALGGLLAGATVTGVLMALFMANAGGAWDNAKKYIEGAPTAARARSRTRPPSSATPSATRSRTRRDPSLNILIKLMSVVALVLAPWFVRPRVCRRPARPTSGWRAAPWSSS